MRFRRLGVIGTIAVASVLGMATSANAVVGGPPSVTPAAWTPQIATSGTDGTVEIVRQMVQCGNTMYAVGTFSSIKRYSTTFTRNNAFSFNATTGVVSSWNPNVAGTVVDSIALSPDCSTAYLGGLFTSVNGVAAKNVAAVSTSTGSLLTGFAHSASGHVSTVAYTANNHVLVGGYFTGINGSARQYLVSLNPTTGKDDNYVPSTFTISGNYSYTDAAGHPAASNATRVYNFAMSPDKTKILMMGDFTSVAGQQRQQIFMADLGATSVTLDPWYSTEFNQNCATVEPFYLQAAAWSPDGSTIYTASTGYKPASGPGYATSDPRAGLCDAAAAFPATPASVSHLWINYTGCDSLFAAAADSKSVYIGGHERFANNGNACDALGPAPAVNAPGMAGLDPATGMLNYNPTRGRGQGADDMLVTSAGLWIASDNAQNTNNCGVTDTTTNNPAYGHMGICFLPY